MTLSHEQLQRAAAESGFQVESYEKAHVLVQILEGVRGHPFLGPRMALKGGTALNLFVLDLPRLSVDIDLNYVGAPDRETMVAERPRVETAIQQVAGRAGLNVRRVPTEHAGGKWRLSYVSAARRPGTIEVDVNFMLRTPLWPAVARDSHPVGGSKAERILALEEHELAAGKLAGWRPLSLAPAGTHQRRVRSRPTVMDTRVVGAPVGPSMTEGRGTGRRRAGTHKRKATLRCRCPLQTHPSGGAPCLWRCDRSSMGRAACVVRLNGGTARGGAPMGRLLARYLHARLTGTPTCSGSASGGLGPGLRSMTRVVE